MRSKSAIHKATTACGRVGSRLFGLLLIVVVLVGALADTFGQERGDKGDKPAPERRTPTVVLKMTPAPSGDYTIALPRGWLVKGFPGTKVAMASPPGAQLPLIYVLPAMRVSDLRYQRTLEFCNRAFTANPLAAPNVLTQCIIPAVQSQLEDSSFRWSPQQALRSMIAALSGANPTAFGTPEITVVKPNEILFRVSRLERGVQTLDWGHLVMLYLDNPLLSSGPGRPGVTSLAFVSGCEAPASQEASFRPICAASLRSLRFSQSFTNNLLSELQQTYQAEVQILLQAGRTLLQGFAINSMMIQNTFAAVRQMQFEDFQRQMEARLDIANSWMNTLSQTQDFVDPQTGDVYNFPHTGYQFNYRYNCITGAGATVEYYHSDTQNCTELAADLSAKLHRNIDLRPIKPIN